MNQLPANTSNNGKSALVPENTETKNLIENILGEKTLVRKATPEDFPQVLGLIKELALFEKEPDVVTNTVEKMNLEQDNFHLFVAEHDGKIIGYAIAFFAYSTWKGRFLYLDDVFVQDAFRGKKIGEDLLQEVFMLARDNGVERLRWQVLDWNKGAIKKYISMGAEISKDWLNCTFDKASIHHFLEHKT